MNKMDPMSRRNALVRGAVTFALGTAAGSLPIAQGADKPSNTTSNCALTDTNRRIVLQFVEMFYGQRKVRQAFETFVADQYIQHNPSLLDGRESAIAALEPMFTAKGSTFDVKHVLVDGDLAAVHLHGRASQDNPGGAVVDMFRLANGKIVEHWDVLQAIPAQSKNPRGMF